MTTQGRQPRPTLKGENMLNITLAALAILGMVATGIVLCCIKTGGDFDGKEEK